MRVSRTAHSIENIVSVQFYSSRFLLELWENEQFLFQKAWKEEIKNKQKGRNEKGDSGKGGWLRLEPIWDLKITY